MAMTIDPQRIADQELTFKEAKYLKVRGRLPKDYPMPEEPDMGEEEEVAPPPTRVTPIEEQTVPKIEDRGGIVSEDEDEEEDYEEGWNNNQRRAALSKRGLSVDGKKSDLISRLRRSDSNNLEDDDYSTLDD